MAIENINIKVRTWYFLILAGKHAHILSQRTFVNGHTINVFQTIEKEESNTLKIRTVQFPIRNPWSEVQKESVENLFFILDTGDRLEKVLETLFNSRLPTHLEEELSQAAGLIKVIKGTALRMLDGLPSVTKLNRFRFFRPMTRKIIFL